MKLSEISDATPDAEAPKPIKLSQVGAAAKPAEGGSGIAALWNQLAGGIKAGGAGMKQGLGDVAVGTGQLAAHGAKAVGFPGGETASKWLDQIAQQREQSYQESPTRQAHPFVAGAGRVMGNVAGTAPLMAVPGGQATLAGRIGAGAAAGAAGAATQPVTSQDYWGEKTKQAIVGAGIGGALPGLGGLARPVRPDAQMLMGQGVQLTPGQQLGGVTQRAERTMSRFPILGDYLRGREATGVDGFNRAAMNQALEPIGVRVPPQMQAGHDLIDYGYQAYRQRYESLLPRVNFVEDEGFRNGFERLRSLVGEAGDEAVTRFDRTMRRVMAPLGEHVGTIERQMDGISLKQVERDLDRAIRLNRAGDGTARQLADAFRETQSLFRQTLARQNPALANDLRNVDYGYAMLSRLRDAGTRRADSEGRFDPRDLLQAIRSGERQFSTWNFATGDALLQAFAEAGNRVLGRRLPAEATYMGPLNELTTILSRGPAALAYGATAGGRAVGGAADVLSPAGPGLAAAMSPEGEKKRRDYFERRGMEVAQ